MSHLFIKNFYYFQQQDLRELKGSLNYSSPYVKYSFYDGVGRVPQAALVNHLPQADTLHWDFSHAEKEMALVKMLVD